MPTANKIRFVNVKYNDDKRVLPNVVLNLRGNHTLALLQNAGGKTVLNKFLMQPILFNYDVLKKQDKVYFDMRSFFRTNPSTCYVLIEWELEDNNGFLLTGVGMKRGQDDNMLKVSFIYEYTKPGRYSIENFPLIIESEGVPQIKSLENLYDELAPYRKKGEIFCYRNTNYQHRREFREKLLEYRINETEWKNIHAKINSMEGGLQELFLGSPKTKDLLEQWIIPAVEDKILAGDESEDRLVNIKDRFLNFIENKERKLGELKALGDYRDFKEDMEELLGLISEKGRQTSIRINSESNLAYIYMELSERKNSLKSELTVLEEELKVKTEKVNELKYTALSFEIQGVIGTIDELDRDIKTYEAKIGGLAEKINEHNESIRILSCARKYSEFLKHIAEKDSLELKLKPLEEKLKEYEETTNNIRYSLKMILNDKTQRLNDDTKQRLSDIESSNESLRIMFGSQSALNSQIKEHQEKIVECSRHIDIYLANYERFSKDNPDIERYLENRRTVQREDEILNFLNDISKEKDGAVQGLSDVKYELFSTGESIRNLSDVLGKDRKTLSDVKRNYDITEIEYKKFSLEEANLVEMAAEFDFSKRDIYNKPFALARINELLYEVKNLEEDFLLQNNRINEKIRFYEESRIPLSDEIKELFREEDIDFEFGLDWIRNYEDVNEKKRELLNKNPLIPYALIVDEKSLSRAEGIICNHFTESIVPLLIKKEIDNADISRINSLFKVSNISFFAGYTEELIDEEYMNHILEELKEHRRENDGRIKDLRERTNKLNVLHSNLERFNYASDQESIFIKELSRLKNELDRLEASAQYNENEILSKREEQEALSRKREALETKMVRIERLEKETEYILELFNMYDKAARDKAGLQKEFLENSRRIEDIGNSIKQLEAQIQELKYENRKAEDKIDDLKENNKDIFAFTGSGRRLLRDDGSFIDEVSLRSHLEEYNSKKEYSDVSLIKDGINREINSIKDIEEDIASFGIEKEKYLNVEYDKNKIRELEEKIKDIGIEKDELIGKRGVQEGLLRSEERLLSAKREECLRNFLREYFEGFIEERDYPYLVKIASDELNKTAVAINSNKNMFVKVENWLYELSDFEKAIISDEAELISLADENFDSHIRDYRNRLQSSLNSISSLDIDIKRTVSEVRLRYDDELNNKELAKVIGGIVQILQSEMSRPEQGIKLSEESVLKLINMLEMKIVQLEQAEQKIESEFNALTDIVTQHADKIYEELRIIDRSSRIGGKKLFMLDIKAEYNPLSIRDYLAEISDICLGRELNEKNKILKDNITSTRILNSIIPLGLIKASVVKFNAKSQTKTIPYENIHPNSPNFECSGAQRTIISFAILQCILHYTNENIVMDGKKTASLMFLDNPFAVMSTKELLDVFFDIADKYRTQLYCWTDIAKPEIIKKFKNIYSVQIVPYGQKEVLKFEENEMAEEGVTASNFKEESFSYDEND